jgi:alcohol dehydrogenase class IV
MLSEKTFTIRPLPSIVFGVGSSLGLAGHVRALGRSCAMVVTDPGLMRAGVITPMLERLAADGITVKVFDGVEANPTDRNVEDGAALLRSLADPVVIAIGGGSAMDCGKAIALLGPNPGSVAALQATPPSQPGVPVIAVATTAGTGSETNSACVITNTALGRKTYVVHPSIVPVVSLLDPSLTLKLPPYPTATCGFDVLTHAVEACSSSRTTPYSDGVALQAIHMVATNLPIVLREPDNLEARAQMMLASSMAAIAFNVSGLGAAHGTGHALSARLNAAHGQTLATMLPHVMAANMPIAYARYARVADVLGAADPAGGAQGNGQRALDAIVTLRRDIGLERSISDLGGTNELLPLLVSDAVNDPVNRSNPRPLAAEDFEALYRAAW